MHRERTRSNSNNQECTGAHKNSQERRITSDKGHMQCLINSQTSTHLTSAVSAAAVLFFWMLLRILFE